MDAGEAARVGLERAHRNLRRAVSDAEGTTARDDRADTIQGGARRTGGAVDPTSGQKAEQLPTYNIYSIDGDVTGPLVYVNYGRPEDYEELDALGISVRGAIVIARYGGSFRGTKPKIAAEHGAIGCLIYSDPRDDGYFADAVFPDGPMRNKDGVQRGSVMDLPTYSGDPFTPGIPAVPGTTRLAIGDAPTLTKIPVLPISYGDAQPLLAAMGGPWLRRPGAEPCRSPIGSVRDRPRST